VALALCTMDRVGRVPLLLVSSVGCVVGLMLLGGAFIDQHSNPQLAVLGLCCFMACFSVGWGPLTGVLLAEVFPLRIRGTAVGIGWAINRVVSGSVALCFLPLTRALGESGTFFAFAFVGLLSVYFTAMVVPETNNLTLEAITHLFNARATAGATSSPSILQRFTTSRRR
jgi:MFS family permease